MMKGRLEIGVRGSICVSVFIVGAGAPVGVNDPWASRSGTETKTNEHANSELGRMHVFIQF